jgi:hypothetical protein
LATALQATITPLVPKGTKSPLQLSSQQALQAWSGMPATVRNSLINDLQNVTSTINTLHQNLQQSPQMTQLLQVNSAGQVVAAVGQMTYQGTRFVNYFQELHVGNPDAATNPTNPQMAVFNANTDGSISIGNTGWLDVHDEFSGNAAWIGTQNDALVITNAVNNGSGLIRLTVTGHTLATGNICGTKNLNRRPPELRLVRPLHPHRRSAERPHHLPAHHRPRSPDLERDLGQRNDSNHDEHRPWI